MSKLKLWLCIVLISIGCSSYAAITLPYFFSSNMILQRDKPVKVWGTAAKNENITVSFNNQRIQAKANAKGDWSVTLQPMAWGGPYDMTIAGKKETKTFSNVLIGDVWICSGQSNMEWPLGDVSNTATEVPASSFPNIRLFTVEKDMAMTPKTNVKQAAWQVCGPESSRYFSAVGYFFGKQLHKDLNIPIGLINTSWGGTNIQTWTSWDVMRERPEYKNIDVNAYAASLAGIDERKAAFGAALQHDKGVTEKWYNNNVIGWKPITQPASYESSEIGNADGIVWFKKEFDVNDLPANAHIVLSLGPVDDIDSTYLNGQLVGTGRVWNQDRVYTIPTGNLKKGKNTIVIKVVDGGGGGGLTGHADQLYIEVEGAKIPLTGQWQYKPSVLSTDFGLKEIGPNAFPSQLYNAMIAPLIHFAIKGAIWYQGESNADEAAKYKTMFPAMIKNWRNKWGDDFPFIWVQLANFMDAVAEPAESAWAELRDAQHSTLKLPQTGEAVIIDIGEAKDIHPRNKKDVGYRLALAAEKVAYNKDIVHSGPVYKSMQVQGDKIILSFDHIGNGLVAKDKYAYLRGFTIAGEDKKFVWAQAQIVGNTIVVHNAFVKKPVAVRYAWANNPDDANLYNADGLPASPFRTDNWLMITEGKSSY
jgi:sialate O-acetylesterase